MSQVSFYLNMGTGSRSDVQDERDPIPRCNRGIAGIRCQIKMRAGDFGGSNGHISVTQFEHQARNGIALDVEILKEPGGDTTLPVENKSSRESDADHVAVRVHFRDVFVNVFFDVRIVLVGPKRFLGHRIQNAVSSDRCRAGVRQERERNAVLPAEGRKRRHRVVADGRDSQSLSLKFLDLTLQLDQLRLAVRSPVCRAEKDQHRAFGPQDGLQRHGLAVLILQAEIRYTLPYLETELRDIDF